jgi:hypothetical protein
MALGIGAILNVAGMMLSKSTVQPTLRYGKSIKSAPVATTTSIAAGTVLGNYLATNNDIDITEIALELLEVIENIAMALI